MKVISQRILLFLPVRTDKVPHSGVWSEIEKINTGLTESFVAVRDCRDKVIKQIR